MIAFVPLFFFASMYAQISLGESASETGLYLLIFFAGFAVASQWGGKILDSVGARPAVVLGCAVAAVGFYLWGKSPDPTSRSATSGTTSSSPEPGSAWCSSPANTDALNRVPRSRYGEATGITQTVRNFGSSLGLAVLGSILILENRSNLESSLGAKGVPKAVADQVADCVSQGNEAGCEAVARGAGRHAAKLFSTVPHDFALASRTVFYGFAAVMAVAFVVALAKMPAGKVEEEVPETPPPSAAGPA